MVGGDYNFLPLNPSPDPSGYQSSFPLVHPNVFEIYQEKSKFLGHCHFPGKQSLGKMYSFLLLKVSPDMVLKGGSQTQQLPIL